MNSTIVTRSLAVVVALCATTLHAQDPRVGLRGGWMNAAEAAGNLRLVAHRPRPQGFFDPERPGEFGLANSDLAFKGTLLVQGSFNGFQIWDISDPTNPTIRTAFA